MAKIDFMKSLNEEKVSDIEAPPSPPVGHYILACSKVNSGKRGAGGRYFYYDFVMKGVGPDDDTDDVDAEELAEFGGADKVVSSITFMFDTEEGTEADLDRFKFRVKKFLTETLRVDDIDDVPLAQAATQAVNYQCVGLVEVEEADDGNKYTRITKSLPLAA